MNKSNLKIITTSTRPGRVGPVISSWIEEAAKAHGGFAVELIDLADFNLPVFDEPHHPKLQQYQNSHTKLWSECIASADAFVFVTPEYNFNAPPALINALNYLYIEWNYKPASFVSYAFASGGLRAVESIKPLISTLKMVPLVEQVMIPMFGQNIKDGAFHPNEVQTQAATTMLNELLRWTEALSVLRT